MSVKPEKIIVASMNSKTMEAWSKSEKHRKRLSKKSLVYLSAVIFCLSAGTYVLSQYPEQSESAISVLSTGFEYDETLGRLQYVSNILPESAMVFLSSEAEKPDFFTPSDGNVLHAWSQQEPWIEYECPGSIMACEAGDVMTIVKNRENEYTVRMLHQGGYESIYSGLKQVYFAENETVEAGSIIGSAEDAASFELRKDGLSILPPFSAAGEMD